MARRKAPQEPPQDVLGAGLLARHYYFLQLAGLDRYRSRYGEPTDQVLAEVEAVAMARASRRAA